MNAMPKRQPYPPAVRREALEIAGQANYQAASDATGVPTATIRSWAKRETDRAGAAARVVGGVEVVGQPRIPPWSERRDGFIAGLGIAVELAAAQLRRALAEGRARDSRDLSVTTGILVDKVELLTGATNRSESYSVHGDVDLASMRAEVAANERRLAELQAGGE
jgi:hypothetical protein